MFGFRIAALAALMALSASGSVFAQAQASGPEGRGTVVVELFTSQGCSLCPPADAFFHSIADHDDVIALALHVDYWDYIGWPDHFASPAFTARQKAYAKANGAHSVYTPQMVVDGDNFLGGAQAMIVANSIFDKRDKPDAALVDLARSGEYLTIRLTPRATVAVGQADAVASDAAPSSIYLVRYIPEATVDIARGENAGKTILYRNIVSEWRELDKWDGERPVTIDTVVEGDEPIVVIVQQAGHGPILGAAALR
jgi:hypothetical protein